MHLKEIFNFITKFWGRPLRCDESLALLMTGCYHTFININDIHSDKVFFKLTRTLHTMISLIMSHLELLRRDLFFFFFNLSESMKILGKSKANQALVE